MNSAQLINQTSGIYRIRNTQNSHQYVGSAVNLRRRRKDHFTKLKIGSHHCAPLQRAWVKYGPDAFVFEVLEFAEPGQLLQLEQLQLDAGENLYNVCRVAYSHLGVKRSPETIARMREACKTRKRPGPHTPEHRAKISAANLGRKASAETIQKMRLAKVGQIITPEHREKIAAARRGRPGHKHSAESRAKIALSHIGMTASDVARNKMRAAKLGTKAGEATRIRMSVSQKARYASKK